MSTLTLPSLGGTIASAASNPIGTALSVATSLFSDAAHHSAKVQAHMTAYQEIFNCAMAGSLPAARKLLWGQTGDYDEIKANLAAGWNQLKAKNPALAAQAVAAGGTDNNAVSLASFSGCAASIPASTAATVGSAIANALGLGPTTMGGGVGVTTPAVVGGTSPLVLLLVIGGAIYLATRNRR